MEIPQSVQCTAAPHHYTAGGAGEGGGAGGETGEG